MFIKVKPPLHLFYSGKWKGAASTTTPRCCGQIHKGYPSNQINGSDMYLLLCCCSQSHGDPQICFNPLQKKAIRDIGDHDE